MRLRFRHINADRLLAICAFLAVVLTIVGLMVSVLRLQDFDARLEVLVKENHDLIGQLQQRGVIPGPTAPGATTSPAPASGVPTQAPTRPATAPATSVPTSPPTAAPTAPVASPRPPAPTICFYLPPIPPTCPPVP